MNTNYTSLNSDIQEFFDTWKSQFEVAPEMDCPFEVTSFGILCVKGVSLCHGSELNLTNSSFDVESLLLSTKTGVTFTVMIEMPFDGKPDISCVLKTEQVYPVVA